MSFLKHTQLAAFVVLVAAVLASHPYLEEAGLCGHGGCPEASQSSHATHATHAGPSGACLAAVLAAAGASVPAFFAFLKGRAVRQRRPAEAYLVPEPPPPRVPRALPSH